MRRSAASARELNAASLRCKLNRRGSSNDWTTRSELTVNPRRPAPQAAGDTGSFALRDPLPNGRGEAGLGATADKRRNAGATCGKLALVWRMSRSNRRPQALEQCKVHQRHSYLDPVRHARPVGVAEELVAHVPA